MDQFHDRQHVWLRSSERGRYLHADDDGVGVSLCKSRASMNAAWAVHLYLDDRDGIQYVLLQSAAYGRYLAGTDASAPIGRCGFRVEQRNYDQTPQADAIRWQAVRAGLGVHRDDIMLRHVGTHFRYLRANGKYLLWILGVTVDEYPNISSMMQWVVEPILPRQGMPRLPRPISERLPGDLSVVILGRAEAEWRTIPYVRAADDGSYPAEGADGLLHFMGRSVHRLREQLAPLLWGQFGVFDFIMCLRPGREGRLTPLVVHLPRDGAIEIVVITDGTPVRSELRHLGIRAGRNGRLSPLVINLPWDTYPRTAMVLPSRSSSSWTGHQHIHDLQETYPKEGISRNHKVKRCEPATMLGKTKIKIRNTVTCSFNGTPKQAYRSFAESVIHLLNWNKMRGTEVSYDSIVNQKASIFTTPPSGTFHFLLKYGVDASNFIIDGRTGWGYGFINSNGIWLFKPSQPLAPTYEHYIKHTGVTVLPVEATYKNISPDEIKENIEIGIGPMIEATIGLSRYDGSMDPEVLKKLMIFVGRVIFSICEGYKFREVLDLNLSVMERGIATTIGDSHAPRPANYVKGWGDICSATNSSFFKFIKYGVPLLPFKFGDKHGGIKTIKEALKIVNVAPYMSVNNRMCRRQPRKLNTWSPVDSGEGDEDICLLGNVDLSKHHPSFQEKFRSETDYFLGNRVGGPAHWTAKQFLNQRRPSEINPYRASLPFASGEKFPYPLLAARLQLRRGTWAKVARAIRCFRL